MFANLEESKWRRKNEEATDDYEKGATKHHEKRRQTEKQQQKKVNEHGALVKSLLSISQSANKWTFCVFVYDYYFVKFYMILLFFCFRRLPFLICLVVHKFFVLFNSFSNNSFRVYVSSKWELIINRRPSIIKMIIYDCNFFAVCYGADVLSAE